MLRCDSERRRCTLPSRAPHLRHPDLPARLSVQAGVTSTRARVAPGPLQARDPSSFGPVPYPPSAPATSPPERSRLPALFQGARPGGIRSGSAAGPGGAGHAPGRVSADAVTTEKDAGGAFGSAVGCRSMGLHHFLGAHPLRSGPSRLPGLGERIMPQTGFRSMHWGKKRAGAANGKCRRGVH